MSHVLIVLGDWTLFALHSLKGVWRGGWLRTIVPVAYQVGVLSLPVVAVTGTFVGLVLAVQAYGQLHRFGLETALGSLINMSILKELGPVLTGVMLAGRVGSAMAAELGTMRVTEQIDAMGCLGVDPIHHLVTPRFLACLGLIPFLTAIANLMGVIAGAGICEYLYGIEPHHYWEHARRHVAPWDIFSGLFKSLFFGAALALISCHRGFRSTGGAVGVGRAATEAFVASFIAILVLDFFLVLVLNSIEVRLWPTNGQAG